MFCVLGCQAVMAETYSVCEVLASLSELNAKTIEVHGAWAKGDNDQSIHAIQPCEKRTIRDGWLFGDGIEALPRDGKASVAIVVAEMRSFARSHPNGWIVVTMKGKLETSEKFEIRHRYYDDVPEAYHWWPARLNYWKVTRFESVPIDHEEYEAYWHPWFRDPDPKRMPSNFPYGEKRRR